MEPNELPSSIVEVDLIRHDDTSILLGQVFAVSRTDTLKVDVLGSGITVEIGVTDMQSNRASYRFDISPLVEQAVKMAKEEWESADTVLQETA